MYFSTDNGIYAYDGVNLPAKVADNSPYGRFVEFNGKLYFEDHTYKYGNELWFYDGINPPEMVEDLYTVPYNTYPSSLVASNGQLFFGIHDGESQMELWTCSSTNSVTRVANLSTIFEFNNTIYFCKHNVNSGLIELWRYSDPSLFVSSPNAGEVWLVGTQETITWTVSDILGSETINVEYSIDAGNTWNPINTIPIPVGVTSYGWSVPGTESTTCLVRVNETTGLASDTSDGDSWPLNYGWRNPQDPTQFNDRGTEHTWIGVTLNTDQSHVIELDFRNFQFTGTIPDLSALTQLEYMDLAYNHLSGSIPSSITNLTNLHHFNLRGCQLSGPLPPGIPNMDNPSFAIDISWNALYTDDPQVKAFVDGHHFTIYYNGSYVNWTETQTVAPTDVLVSEVNIDSVVVSWTPILYQGDTGGYRVYYSGKK